VLAIAPSRFASLAGADFVKALAVANASSTRIGGSLAL
jgi:hypothetical protein